MDLEQIEKLHELKKNGLITEEEFQRAKEKILAGNSTAGSRTDNHSIDNKSTIGTPDNINIKTNNYTYALMMHLSQLASWIVPILGVVVPLVLWLSRREEAYIDQQGKVVMNWVCSSLIYAAICWVLHWLLIGYLLFGIFFVLALIFIIKGAINANRGVIKNYPLSIRFFEVDETSSV